MAVLFSAASFYYIHSALPTVWRRNSYRALLLNAPFVQSTALSAREISSRGHLTAGTSAVPAQLNPSPLSPKWSLSGTLDSLITDQHWSGSLRPAVGEGEAVEPLNWTVSPAHSPLPPSTSEPPDAAYRSPEAASSSSSSGSDVRRSYMLTHTYGGQLTRAIKNMMIQQCWARDLVGGATLVEPFSSNSFLLNEPFAWGTPRSAPSLLVARFSDYFDLQFYNQTSMERDGAPLVAWEEFLAKAPREMVVVVTPVWTCKAGLHHAVQTLVDSRFESLIKGLEYYKFVVIKKVMIYCSDPERGQNLVKNIIPFLSNSTIVFGSWKSYIMASSWLHISDHCNTSDKYPASRLRPSAKIQRHMENYKSSVLQANKTIAIMLRVERFLTLKSSGRSNETVDSCLKKTMSVYEGLRQQAQWVGSKPYLTLDIGRFGSGIMQTTDSVSRFGESLREVTKLVTKFLVRIYNSRWKTITEWEDSFVQATGGVQERGYVAMLQRGIAVESDCLILMGGGSYQEVAATQYLEGHPSPGEQCLHTVCVDSTNLLSETLRNRGEATAQKLR